MWRVPLLPFLWYGCFHKRERGSESCFLIDFLGGQDRPFLPAWDFPRWTRRKKGFNIITTRAKQLPFLAILPVFETEFSRSFESTSGQIFSLFSSFVSLKTHRRKRLTDGPLHNGCSARQDETFCRKRKNHKYLWYNFIKNGILQASPSWNVNGNSCPHALPIPPLLSLSNKRLNWLFWHQKS